MAKILIITDDDTSVKIDYSGFANAHEVIGLLFRVTTELNMQTIAQQQQPAAQTDAKSQEPGAGRGEPNQS